MKTIGKILCTAFLLSGTAAASQAAYDPVSARHGLSLKVPGNPAKEYALQARPAGSGNYELVGREALPLRIGLTVSECGDATRVSVRLRALDDVWFHYAQLVPSGYRHEECQFLMPGFWYRRNLRSPEGAPSFKVSDSWTVREDRLSTPLCAVYDPQGGKYVSVLRTDRPDCDALTTHREGEVIVSGRTSLGYTGFENLDGRACLSFGFPYRETPRSYVRKLTLAPSVRAFQHLRAGEELTLGWEIVSGRAEDFSELVRRVWEYSYAALAPRPVETPYTPERMKEVLSRYFTQAYVSDYPLRFTSGVHLRTADCRSNGMAEVGFIGRVLLNAFNALEYGQAHGDGEMAARAAAVFDSYLAHGFTPGGLLRESVDFAKGTETDVFSIRRQSEGIYALLYYLDYEKRRGNRHPQWERRVTDLLDRLIRLQGADGSFPRKFGDDLSVVDAGGGSTSSATLPLVMAYRYFGEKKYLECAERTAGYLEREIIDKSDYFSSTLDANCEDKEASLYASTAMYYLTLVTRGEERARYAALCREAAYFALSWYYLWDVPFAPGQMLGDIGLKTRGWGNVSVENNHIDVFVFEFAAVLDFLAGEFGDDRLSGFSKVIHTSMRQLLPYPGHLCGVAREGYYPEVVQHTAWDYGKNGKGYYNDIFAPGWTVASLWELFSPERTHAFFSRR